MPIERLRKLLDRLRQPDSADAEPCLVIVGRRQWLELRQPVGKLAGVERICRDRSGLPGDRGIGEHHDGGERD